MGDRWVTKTLGEISQLNSGGTPLKSNCAFWDDGDIPWYTSGELNDIYTKDPQKCITQEGLKGSNAKLFPKGSLLIGMYDTAALKTSILDRDATFNQAVAGVLPRDGTSFKFLLYAIWYVRPVVLKLRRGIRQKNLSLTKIKAITIPYPPLATQCRIVAILDEAFAAIQIARAAAEKNLENARELYRSALRLCFDQSLPEPDWMKSEDTTIDTRSAGGDVKTEPSGSPSRTRGRAATDRVIVGELSLAVGMPPDAPRPGWKWSTLSDLARLESGHTPSRRKPEYWDGDVPWIGIRDAKANHNGTIADTQQHTSELGLANSAARLLPAGTVCLSRTASVGYVVVMGRPMATSQDFVNWVCTSALVPEFLKFLLVAEGEGFSKYASGAVHQTIYFPEVKAFHVCHPAPAVQRRIVEFIDTMQPRATQIENIATRKLTLLNELKQSLLQKAFSGELTANEGVIDRELAEAGV